MLPPKRVGRPTPPTPPTYAPGEERVVGWEWVGVDGMGEGGRYTVLTEI